MNKKSIIFFGPSDWWNMNPSSGTHLAKNLSHDNWVLYINPISTDLGGTLKSAGISKFFLYKIARKLKSFLTAFRKINDNLCVYSPIFLPFQGKIYIDLLNNILIWIQIRIIIFFNAKYISRVMWIENIRAIDFLNYSRWNKVIYHVSDLYTENRYSKDREVLHKRDELASKRSDLIICVSVELYNLKKRKYPNVYYLPHGVDFEKYFTAAKSGCKHPLLSNVKGPLIGYFGTLTQANDIKMLEFCAAKFPDYNFIFAGKITGGDYNILKKMNNVHLLGFIPYDEISLLCSSFDVCLLPWMMTPWIEHCNPLKLFEYMACGKPVVSVPIKEVVYNYSDVVSIAYSAEEFSNAIDWELKNDNSTRENRRIEIAKNNSWERHIDIIYKLLENKQLPAGKYE